MVKLEILPEEVLSLQVMGEMVKAGQPSITPRYITENGVYIAKDGVSGFSPVTVEVDMTPAMEEGYKDGMAAGKAEGYKEGYDKGSEPAQYIRNIEAMFKNVAFPVGFRLDWTVADASGSSNSMLSFANGATGLKSIKLSFVNKGTAVNANYAFAGVAFAEDTLEEVDISGMGCAFSSFAGTFQNRKALKRIIGTVDLTGCINCTAPFPNSTALEEIAFKQGTIPKNIQFNNQPNLTDASVKSIIEGLTDLTGQTTQTLTFHKEAGAKLTDAQKATVTAKNWTLVY